MCDLVKISRIDANVSQKRSLSDSLQPDYVGMHDIARHVIHSSEVLAIAIETTTSMIQEHDVFFEENPTLRETAPMISRQIKRDLQLHSTVLKCLHLRSTALEQRLRNEISLV